MTKKEFYNYMDEQSKILMNKLFPKFNEQRKEDLSKKYNKKRTR